MRGVRDSKRKEANGCKRARVLSPFSTCVCLVVVTCLLVVVVPGTRLYFYGGTPDTDYSDDVLTLWDERCADLALQFEEQHPGKILEDRLFSHGWPQPFLARYVAAQERPDGSRTRELSEPIGGISWSNFDNWPFAADEFVLRPWALVIDILACVGIVLIATGMAEYWMRKRRGKLAFQLIDLVVCVTVSCVVFAWHAYHVRLTRLEESLNQQIGGPLYKTYGVHVTGSRRYAGPDWLRRLCGREPPLSFLYHVDHLYILCDPDWRNTYDKLPLLPHLESLELAGEIPLEALERLEACRQLRFVTIAVNPYEPVEFDAGTKLFTAADAKYLQSLPVRRLKIVRRKMLVEDIEAVLKNKTLRHLRLADPLATPEEIDELNQRYPDVHVTATWYYSYMWRSKPAAGYADEIQVARDERGLNEGSKPASYGDPTMPPDGG